MTIQSPRKVLPKLFGNNDLLVLCSLSQLISFFFHLRLTELLKVDDFKLQYLLNLLQIQKNLRYSVSHLGLHKYKWMPTTQNFLLAS